MRSFSSHGDGVLDPKKLSHCGTNVIFEANVRLWHPETVRIGSNVYIGHDTYLKSYPTGKLEIGNDCWIGQQSFFHAAGGIFIEEEVGIGPRVSILTSFHKESGRERAILDAPLEFAPVRIGRGSDIGLGAILLPGVTIGRGAQVGAGAVVAKNVEPFSVVAGNPARQLKMRAE